MGSGLCPFAAGQKPKVTIDGATFDAPAPASDRSWSAHFRKADGKWTAADSVNDGSLRKRHDLVAFDPIILGAGSAFLENTNHFEAATLGECD